MKLPERLIYAAKFLVSGTDTTPGRLIDKLTYDEPIFALTDNPGGNEALRLVIRNSGRSSGGELRATISQSNLWDTNGNSNSLREVVGSDFSYVGTGQFAIVDGHSLAYVGIPQRDVIVRACISVIPSAAQTSKTCGFGIAYKPFGGAYDIAGLQIVGNAQTDACVMPADLPIAAVAITPELNAFVQRRFSLISTLDQFCVFGAKENGNADLKINGFSMTVELLALSGTD